MNIDAPVAQPLGPQVVVIQRAAVELLNHVPTYNGESTAAAISFIGAADNAKRNEAESSARMIIACGARLTRRASQWYETVTSSDMRDNSQNPGIMMVDELPNTLAGWKYFTRLFLAAFTSSTETFDLRDQLKKLMWNPDKDAIKVHILTMTTILHSMSLLGDTLTDRDKVEYFMSSLVKKSYLVKKINLSHSFDQACCDVVEFVSKEKIAATIIDQHSYKQPAGAKLYNLEPYDEDDDDEAYRHDNHPRSMDQLNALYNAECNAMRMDWMNKLTPEERRRFEHQLCIGCGEAGHIRRNCLHKLPVDNKNVQKTFNSRPSNGPPPRQSYGPSKTVYPRPNNDRNNFSSGNHPKHNMGG